MKKLIFLTLIGLVIPALLFAMLGCMKPPEANRDFGPQVTLDEFKVAMAQMPVASVYSVKQGEFSYREETLRIENLPAEVIRQEATTVVLRDDETDPQLIKFVVETETKDYASNEKPTTNQETFYVKKQGTLSTQSVVTFPQGAKRMTYKTLFPFSKLSYSPTDSEPAQPAIPHTYHNLITADITIKQPLLSVMEPDCAGYAPEKCNQPLAAKKIQIDEVDWSGKEPIKTTLMAVYSDQIPVLANPLIQCFSYARLIGKQWANIVNCSEVKNLRYGHDTP